MTQEIQQIAARIRELRQLEGLSVETCAGSCGVDAGTFRGYEEGKTDIPVGVLHILAARFRVDITTLLTGEEPHLHSVALTRAGKGVSVERRSQYRYQSLAYSFAHRKAEPFLVTIDPAPEPEISCNIHPGQEFDYVLEGTLLVKIGGREFTLQPGDSVYYDSNQPHGMAALGGVAAKFLSIIF